MKLKRTLQENLTGYMFITPQMALFLIFMLFPIFEGIRLSLYDVGYGGNTFVGLDNYKELLGDPVFIQALVNTVIFVVAIVALTVVFGLFVAASIFDKNAKYVSVIRGSYYIPVMVSMVVMSMIWSFLLSPANGLIPYIGREIGFENLNLLGNKSTVLWVIIFVTFAGNVGQAIILYVAAMIGVPKELFEAAEVDGANRFQTIWHILIPSIKGTTIYIIVLNIINVLKIFVVIQLLTGGGPDNKSMTLMFFLYTNAFKYNRLGLASAVGVIMLVVALVISLPQLRALAKGDS